MEHFKIWNKISDILKRVNVKEKWQIKNISLHLTLNQYVNQQLPLKNNYI